MSSKGKAKEEVVEEVSDYDSLPSASPLSSHLMAGALAGIAEHSIMYPFDSIKTRMQVLNPNPQAIYTGISNALVRISSAEGVRTLWRGVSSMVVGAGPSHALYFATYERCKERFGVDSTNDQHYPLATATAGSCATIISEAFMNPFDVVKQRMQVHGSTFKSSLHCFLSVLKKEGPASFYLSYPTTLLMTVPYQATQFTTYEYFRKILNPSQQYSPSTHIMAGGIAGSVAAVLTTPLDVVKTVLQTRGAEEIDQGARKVSGIKSTIRIVYNSRGIRGFFSGWRPRVITHMPSTAICWTVYEYFKWFIMESGGGSDNARNAKRKKQQREISQIEEEQSTLPYH